MSPIFSRMSVALKVREDRPEPPEATAHNVFEAIMAGASVEDVHAAVRLLPPDEFHILMCTFCLVHQDMAGVCADRADTIAALLQAHCRHFCHGKRTCAPGERAWLFPVI